jgi:hypothetical protein
MEMKEVEPGDGPRQKQRRSNTGGGGEKGQPHRQQWRL